MRIALLSDSHDNICSMIKAVRLANSLQATHMIHCGDLISPFMLKHLNAFNGPVHLIYGNNAGDLHLITKMCKENFPHIVHHGMSGSMVEGERKIGFVHYPHLARGLAATGEYDVVCCGHSHRYEVGTVNDTLLVNCGQLMGVEEDSGFALLDCATLKVERIVVAPQVDLMEV